MHIRRHDSGWMEGTAAAMYKNVTNILHKYSDSMYNNKTRTAKENCICIFIYNAEQRMLCAMWSRFSFCRFETICNVQNIKFVIKLLVIVRVIAPEDFCL